MLYYLFEYLDKNFNLMGAGIFQYISFRAGAAVILSLLITIFFGKKLILLLQNKQIGESVRDLGLQGQMEKKGTPTMGGLIIIGAIVIPTLLFAKLDNIYVILLLITTLWLGAIGFIDDYIKVFKKNKDGLAGKFKILGQVGIGLIVGLILYFHPDVLVGEYVGEGFNVVKSNITSVPFFKDNLLNYENIIPFLSADYTWIIYVLIVTFIITAVSNGVNITDGLDGLAAGTSAVVGITIAILAYISGRTDFTEYLNIMYIPNLGEVVVFSTAFVGACLGFLWYNSYPAQVFMGDTGSLSIGGIIAVSALIIRKELLIPILCGVFLIENLSVIVQVLYFKYTKRKYGEGRRVLKMAPLHHHYQKSNIPEPKIVIRFWITGILLAVLTLATLKLR
ncbi:MAG: phospho-N-acetylmuramoyl-pentapeptide-transferase [Cyclobacteriaceae bacterium]|nr:phospho-N-acetylmuramoyl-pentapeptide-transferase [Cyclobacteriaceae bacterium]